MMNPQELGKKKEIKIKLYKPVAFDIDFGRTTPSITAKYPTCDISIIISTSFPFTRFTQSFLT
jgi:hypothetical protein